MLSASEIVYIAVHACERTARSIKTGGEEYEKSVFTNFHMSYKRKMLSYSHMKIGVSTISDMKSIDEFIHEGQHMMTEHALTLFVSSDLNTSGSIRQHNEHDHKRQHGMHSGINAVLDTRFHHSTKLESSHD